MPREQEINIRSAAVEDAGIITQLLHELAAHDGHGDECHITENDVICFGFSAEPSFEVLLVEVDNGPVGLALFFFTFSVWHATRCLFLSDLYVAEQCRGLGIGKEIFSRLAGIAVERGCELMDWQALTKSDATKFYESMGGRELIGFRNYRLKSNVLRSLADARNCSTSSPMD